MSGRRPQVVNIRPTIQKRRTAKGTSHVVRWTVDGADRSRSLPNDAQAKRYQRRLHNAVDRGERFDRMTGEPEAWTAGVSALEYAAAWYARHWTSWKDRTREGHREQLPHVIVALTDKPCPPEHRDELVEWIRATVCVKPGTDVSKVTEPRAAARWLRSHTLPIVDVDTKVVDGLLDAFAVKRDGSPASINYANKRRATLSKFLATAVADRLLPANPLQATTRKRRTATMAFDDRKVFSVREAHAFLCVLATISPQAQRLVAPLAMMLYGAFARPRRTVCAGTTWTCPRRAGAWRICGTRLSP